MPLDPSIALSVRPPQFQDPQEIQARGLQLRELARRGQTADREDAEQKTIRDLYRSSVGEDGKFDETMFVRGVAQAGLGDKIPAIQKQLADTKSAGIKSQDEELALHGLATSEPDRQESLL